MIFCYVPYKGLNVEVYYALSCLNKFFTSYNLATGCRHQHKPIQSSCHWMTLIKFSKFNLCSTYTWKNLKEHIYFLLDYIDYITNILMFFSSLRRLLQLYSYTTETLLFTGTTTDNCCWVVSLLSGLRYLQLGRCVRSKKTSCGAVTYFLCLQIVSPPLKRKRVNRIGKTLRVNLLRILQI